MEGIWPVDPDGKVFQVGFQVGPHARPPLSARSKQMPAELLGAVIAGT